MAKKVFFFEKMAKIFFWKNGKNLNLKFQKNKVFFWKMEKNLNPKLKKNTFKKMAKNLKSKISKKK